MPTQGEPRYSGQDLVVAFHAVLFFSLHVFVYTRKARDNTFTIIELPECFGGNAVNLILQQKKKVTLFS